MERAEKVIVADASVIVKWFVQEQYTSEALKLRESYVNRRIDIAGPTILTIEVLNALRYDPQLGLEELKTCRKALDDYCFWMFPSEGDIADLTLETAVKYGITVYDASYVSLAQMNSWRCYTADMKLLEKVKERSILQHIRDYEQG